MIGAEVFNTTEQEIFWYILTNNGIYILKVDIQSFYGSLTKREGFTANLENTKDTTMCVVSRNPLLAGGSLGVYKGKYIAYLCDSSNVYYRYFYLAFDRYNPIVIPHRNKIYYIGGNISTDENDGFMEFNKVTLYERSKLHYGVSLYWNYTARPEVVYPRGFDKEIRLNINNLDASASLYREEIYFFTKKTFSSRGARFYRYNTVTHEWIIYQLDTDVEKSIAIDKIASIKTINVNNMIYIFLMGYNLVSSDKSNENTLQIEVYKFKPFF